MKTALLPAIVLCLSHLASYASADGMPSNSGYRDVRVLNEFHSFDFAKVDVAGEDWAVVRVEQGPPIERNDIPDEAAGRARQGALICDLVNATATPVATLRGVIADGPWSCFAPVPTRILFGTEPIFMVDRSTGPCVCRVNTAILGARRAVLEESTLLPDAWVEEVKPAFEHWRANRETFEGAVDDERKQKLLDMTEDKNPVISYMAYRRLAQTGHLKFIDLPPELLEAQSELGIFVLLLVLHYTPQAQQDELFQRLAKQVDSAKTLNELHGMATACAYEIGMRHKFRVHSEELASYKLLKSIEARIDESSKDGKADGYFDAATREWRSHQY